MAQFFLNFFSTSFDPLSTNEDKIVEQEFQITNGESQTTVEEILD
jgi:hypothetical protein